MKSSFSRFLFFILVFCKIKVSCNIFNHSKECAILLQNFAVASADFMSCVILNARPVQICCSCAKAYIDVIEKYDDILKAKNAKNSTCDERLINQDRLEVIQTTITHIQGLWSNGQCSNCFANKSKPVDLSNSTEEFNRLNFDTTQCFTSLYNVSTKTYSREICKNCSDPYYKVNRFYSNLKETSGNGNVCMDIVDMMNVTQHLWSNVLHCGETVAALEVPLLAISAVVFLLPLLFYAWAAKSARARSSAVLQRNRLSQRFVEGWRSRAFSAVSS